MNRTAGYLAVALLAAGCTTVNFEAPWNPGPTAVARLEPTKGNTAAGNVMFTQRGETVHVSARLTGLKPGADHGFHVHDKGDCSSGDGMSTGGHFNPGAQPHGAHDAAEHHAGDLPSLKADASGAVNASFTTKSLSVGSGANDVIGHGLIVHRDPDDLKTQPTGNAGPRIACGVVVKG